MSVGWDYTNLASFYDKRAEYSNEAISKMLQHINAKPGQNVVDIGAGTGKLTKHLESFGFKVTAIEPCDEMRNLGITNINQIPGDSVQWFKRTGEETLLADSSCSNAFLVHHLMLWIRKLFLLKCTVF